MRIEKRRRKHTILKRIEPRTRNI
ncbi:Protein CBG26119 [Caenorhabditis briggsae]|uniref:Protein CBG26119 n=1 Tax=Caenorhabditis briggsae TaxID=6238 RepID=B6IFG6_CAEBR|nr:Protein CBG26119 [Caenorhabditis briggsae]CAR98646.1 Protein CBG26119 [Caenorhabditis briggsae]